MIPIRERTALEVAAVWGSTDGEPHKCWVIDQMVRRLLECPVVVRSAIDSRGHPYEYETVGENEAYHAFVADQVGTWDPGIAP